VTAVATRSGWREEFDAVASNGDVVTTYGLLSGTRAGRASASGWRASAIRRPVRGAYRARGLWPEVRHHSILFGPRYQGAAERHLQRRHAGVRPVALPAPPDATDPAMAPEGCSSFYALAPVPHLGKLDVDWDVEGPRYRDLILEELERRMLPGCGSGSRCVSTIRRTTLPTISARISVRPSAWSRC
jgi:phytoene desaturase